MMTRKDYIRIFNKLDKKDLVEILVDIIDRSLPKRHELGVQLPSGTQSPFLKPHEWQPTCDELGKAGPHPHVEDNIGY